MLIGTAGHIDHGKTSLIQRLTGRNTDRLPEEIKRGISIELGYAYVPLVPPLPSPAGALAAAEHAVERDAGVATLGTGGAASSSSDHVLGFIDVPGHERFVHTMLAGATGIDFALLVIAADDGVMPQTEEHLDILRLLAIEHGAVALTKVDRAAARVDEVRTQIARLTADSPQQEWPVFALSSITGEGVAALDAHLRAQARRQLRAARALGEGHFRMAIDRVFTLGGIGTIVTGTVHAGIVRVGDEVMIQPRGVGARVRSLHAQDRAAASGRAGQRCALNLAGIAKDDVARGDWAQAPALANGVDRIDAALRASARERRLLAPTRSGGVHVHFHHGTRDVLATLTVLDATAISPNTAANIAPNSAQLVSVNLAQPLAICAGDRFVVRDASAQRTLGGGVVLDCAPPVRGKRAAARLELLRALRDLPATDALAFWLARQPVPIARVRHGWNVGSDRCGELLRAMGARVAADVAFAPAAWQTLRTQATAAVTATHEREPEMPGLEQNRLRRMIAPNLPPDVASELVDELLAEGALARRGAFLALPSHKAEMAPGERVLWERLLPLLMEQPFGPPRVRDLARASGISEAETRSVLRKAARIGTVALVAHDHFFLSDAVAEMADIAALLAHADGAARAAAFRDRIGGGRKVAIQILEFFDRVGFMRRVRDEHVLRRANPWRAAEDTGSAPASARPVPPMPQGVVPPSGERSG